MHAYIYIYIYIKLWERRCKNECGGMFTYSFLGFTFRTSIRYWLREKKKRSNTFFSNWVFKKSLSDQVVMEQNSETL